VVHLERLPDLGQEMSFGGALTALAGAAYLGLAVLWAVVS
jgi:hypothetical protein